MDKPAEVENLQQTAPIVLVAYVKKDFPVGEAIHSRWNPHMMIQLHELRLNVENVMRGDVSPGALAVYAFYIASSYNGPAPLGTWNNGLPGGGYRRILYLRQDSGVLRTACDVINSCAEPVGSGSHLTYKPDKKKPIEEGIADLLLTKGGGVSDQQFADSLVYGLRFVPDQLAIPRLMALAKAKSPEIRSGACFLLKDSFKPGLVDSTVFGSDGDCKR